MVFFILVMARVKNVEKSFSLGKLHLRRLQNTNNTLVSTCSEVKISFVHYWLQLLSYNADFMILNREDDHCLGPKAAFMVLQSSIFQKRKRYPSVS